MAISTPVSYWKLDETSGNASDSVGSNTLTNNNVTYAAGKIANGASFNGTTAFLDSGSTIPNLNNLSVFSYSMWVKPSSFTVEIMPLSKNHKWCRIRTNGSVEGSVGASGVTCNSTSNQTIPTGVWSHILYTYNDTGDRKVHIFLNGTEVTYSTNTACTGTITADGAFNQYIGQYEGGLYRFNGMIDEVGVWNTALTADEASKIYNAGRGNTYPFTDNLQTSLASYYKLDEASGNAVDSIGSNTLTNNNTVTYSAGKINNGADFGTSNTNKNLTNTTEIGSVNSNKTISLWCKINTDYSGTTIYKTFFELGYGTASKYAGYQFIYQRESSINSLRISRDRGCVSSESIVYTNGGSGVISSFGFYHLVLRLSGTTMELFVNGTSVGTVTINTGNGTCNPQDGIYIGSNRSAVEFSSVTIDEVGIWSRALTSTEVVELYNSGNGKAYPLIGAAYAIAITVVNFTLTGVSNTFTKTLRMLGDVQAYTLTGIDTLFARGKGLVADVASFILTGYDTLLRSSGWSNQNKNPSSFTSQIKNTSTFASQTKNTNSWTNKTKS